jgi:hypothetical protein
MIHNAKLLRLILTGFFWQVEIAFLAAGAQNAHAAQQNNDCEKHITGVTGHAVVSGKVKQ